MALNWMQRAIFTLLVRAEYKYEDFLGVIELPELPSTIGWGGTDNCTMFVTARTSLYTFRTTTPGIPKQF